MLATHLCNISNLKLCHPFFFFFFFFNDTATTEIYTLSLHDALPISPAVWPLPYCFVWFDDAAACVSFAVSLAGFTPSLGDADCAATVVVACSAAGGVSFFS